MKTWVLTTVLTSVLFVILTAWGANVTLAWNKSCDTNLVAGYNIYYGGGVTTGTNIQIHAAYTDTCGNLIPAYTNYFSGVYTNKLTVVGITNTSVTVSNLQNGMTYCFAATTYSLQGAESAFSSEVSYTVPFPKPAAPSFLHAK